MTAGRPTKYEDEMLDQAYKLALLGATDIQIADFFEVSEDTIYEWKKNKPLFSEAIKEGKQKADAKIAESLYNRALGFEYVEEQAFKVKVGKDEDEVKVVEVTKYSPPDTLAAKYWLNNRQVDKWRDKTEVSQTITVVEMPKIKIDGEEIDIL